MIFHTTAHNSYVDREKDQFRSTCSPFLSEVENRSATVNRQSLDLNRWGKPWLL